MGCEQKADYYNSVYETEPRYRKHYSELQCYPVYQVALGMLSDIDNPQILELGCGTGQFAQMLWDKGYLCYKGIDFSSTAIGIASGLSPQVFETGDIRNASFDGFNTVVMLEVLEHLGDDLQLIGCIPSGMNIIFSVPSIDDPAHVRFFKKKEDIESRYSELIEIKEIVTYVCWKIVMGTRRG